ncbi:hypothetical protein ACSNOH_11940 [Streptomyces sp. URMC 127]|uniref:hypothetical protein n=1 Tax=Streptomyces sp. URMC 127 TaxID=3423402 RepID=UPI003F1D3C04
MRRRKAAVLAAVVVTVAVVLGCAFAPPGSGPGPAPRARHVAPDGRALAHGGAPAGGEPLLAGAAMVALGAWLGLLVLICNRPRQRAG